MKPNKHINPCDPLAVRDLHAEIQSLEESKYVRLALAEEAARTAASARVSKLREIERRGRFLAAAGLTMADVCGEECAE